MVIKNKKPNFDQICKGNKTKNSSTITILLTTLLILSFVMTPQRLNCDIEIEVLLEEERTFANPCVACIFKNEFKILETASTGYLVIV